MQVLIKELTEDANLSWIVSIILRGRYSYEQWKTDAKNVTIAMQAIVAETRVTLNIIQTDNGTNFYGETTAWMKENNIAYI